MLIRWYITFFKQAIDVQFVVDKSKNQTREIQRKGKTNELNKKPLQVSSKESRYKSKKIKLSMKNRFLRVLFGGYED